MAGRSALARVALALAGLTLAACAAAAPTATRQSEAAKPAATAAPAKPTEAAKPAEVTVPTQDARATEAAKALGAPTAAPAAGAPSQSATPSTTGAAAPTATPPAGPPAPTPAAPLPVLPAATPQGQVAPATRSTDSGPGFEPRFVELEWPPAMRLGDSNIVRISLEPVSDGYVTTVQIDGNRVETRTITITRPAGYAIAAVARLDGIGFDIDPRGEWQKDLPAREAVSWQWTLRPRERGKHSISASVALVWTAAPGSGLPARDRAQIYSRAREITVSDTLGLETSAATAAGLAGLVLGGGMCALALRNRRAPGDPGRLRVVRANPDLALETQSGIILDPARAGLMRAVFSPYKRVVVEGEYRSGYSGARTFLAVPIKPDGRSDAHAIVKIGDAVAIAREYDNYRRFVKDTLPPVTARIQEPPVTAEGGHAGPVKMAALRYTFVGAGDQRPISLREALLKRPDPALLRQLFDTFGPTWWMQRHARTFICAQEYDRALPAHLVVSPVYGSVEHGRNIDGRQPPPEGLRRGDTITLARFPRVELRADGESWSLFGAPAGGQPPLRVRVIGTRGAPPRLPGVYQVVDTRLAFLREAAGTGETFGLPDPLEALPALLNRTIRGTRSIIHGDLNLENALVGPGGAVWLIDFAETREGHPLTDFAHLYADIVAHVVAPQAHSPEEALAGMHGEGAPAWLPLLQTIDGIAGRCLYDPADTSEWDLARGMVCLGALKFGNLSATQKRLQYLTAAAAWAGLGA
jgi:hypothetical protein